MEKEFNLSEKKQRTFPDGLTRYYLEDDVKEFIKLLKEWDDNCPCKTCKKCAKHCIDQAFEKDKVGFMELMEDVIDRYRGRIKKELEKLNNY